MNKKVTFSFKGELNDFINKTERNQDISRTFEAGTTVKSLIESIGPPHPEVLYISANNKAADFRYRVSNNDFIEVFPHSYKNHFSKELHLPSIPGDCPKFILDVHLGVLASYIRMAGFDTLFNYEDQGDEYIAKTAGYEKRIALSRDIGLLKRSHVTYGYWLRSQNSKNQFIEVINRFDLKKYFKPFSRCLKCNDEILEVMKEEIIDEIKALTKENYNRFWKCKGCKQVYWKGSHYDKMKKFIDELK